MDVLTSKLSVVLVVATVSFLFGGERQTLSLNGIWEVAESDWAVRPNVYSRKVPVPGLLDMAEPSFQEIGLKSEKREAFWYRREVVLEDEVPPVALLKFHKAKYGLTVFVNGERVGESPSCFVPAYFDVRDYLKGSGQANVILARVGAYVDAIPDTIPGGKDFEKSRYIPGIYDNVELILTDTPHILNVQVAPDLVRKRLRVVTEVSNLGPAKEIHLSYAIRAQESGDLVVTSQSEPANLGSRQQHPFDSEIALNGQLWSPENPFLYELEVSTGSDRFRTSFGLRSFRFDKESGRAILNGRPYFMRGTNVAIFRFFEDSERGDRPWRAEWVHRLFRAFKGLNWNSVRFHQGFPPELWYRIADEEGFLVQDEFAIWTKSDVLRSDVLIEEYTKWMRERWNHPSVVIWDAQNETVNDETGKAIQAVRHLDLSSRPWDNGWSAPQSEDDCIEAHPYLHTMNTDFHYSYERQGRKNTPYQSSLAKMLAKPMAPRNGPNERSGTGETFSNPVIINEYPWLWLNRDGTPTTLSERIFDRELGSDASVQARRIFYAKNFAMITEYWRAQRCCAGILHSFGLGYSRPNVPRGQTSDNLLDVERVTFEPYFEEYARNAFHPVGVMIDRWQAEYVAGTQLEVPVVIINDLDRPWVGKLQLKIMAGEHIVTAQAAHCQVTALGREVRTFDVNFPAQRGAYRFVAELFDNDRAITKSVRDFETVLAN